jgi:hypothetical protein
MTEMPRFSLKDFLLLLLVLGAAGGARTAYLFTSLDDLSDPPSLFVQSAQGPVGPVKDGKGETWWLTRAPLSEAEEKTAHTAPGFPWLVGSLDNALNDPARTITAVRYAQLALGSLTAGLYFFFARRAFRSSAVGALAGLFCALHPFWIINTLELNDGVLACFLLGLALATGARASQEGDALASLVYGLALAGLALVRAALLPFGVVASLWFLLRCRKVSRGWLCALLAFLGFANGLAPWTVRNLRTFHQVIPVADSMYLHLWMGVNPAANGGPQNEDTLLETLGKERYDELRAEKNQARRYHLLGADVLRQVSEDVPGTLHRRLLAGQCFVFGRAWFTMDGTLAGARPVAPLPVEIAGSYRAVLEATLLGMLVFGLLGWRWSYGWRTEGMPASLAVIWIPLPYLLSHAEILSGPRLPLDGVLLCYSAFALLCLVPGIGGRLLRGAPPQHPPQAYPPQPVGY